MGSFTHRNCSVPGGQGSPQGSEEKRGPEKTPGSSMKSRAQVIAAPAFSRTAFWMALAAVVAVFGLSSAPLRAQSAGALFKHGQNAEAREDYDAAFDNYQKAYAKAPKNLEYRTALYRVRITTSAMHITKGRKLLDAGNDQAALAEFLHAAEIDPSNEAAQQEIARVRKKSGEVAPRTETSLSQTEGIQEDLESMGAPAELKPLSNEPLTLHMTEDSKVVYQAIGKAAGLDMAKFQSCLDAGTHDVAIAAEASTTPAEATGTPSIFVNGKFVGDPTANLVPTYAQIAAMIDAARTSPSPSSKPS